MRLAFAPKAFTLAERAATLRALNLLKKREIVESHPVSIDGGRNEARWRLAGTIRATLLAGAIRATVLERGSR